MKRAWMSLGIAAVFVMTAVVAVPEAAADSHGRTLGRALRSAGKVSHTQSSRQRSTRMPSLSRGQNSRSRGSSSGLNSLRNLGQSRGSSRNSSRSGLGNWSNIIEGLGALHGGGYGGYDEPYGYPWGYGNRHRDEDDMAKAYREVGMVNAMVNLVGVMVMATQQQNVCGTVQQQGPPGQWQREAVVVQPKRYEQYQEWIPELFDPHTGQKSGGYYETRTRLVPEIVEYRDVWVSR